MKQSLLLFAASLLLSFSAFSQASHEDLSLDSAEMEALYQAEVQHFMDSVENTLYYQTGEIQLDNIATLRVPEGFKYLGPEQSAYVLTDLWGNPPAETFGLLFPDTASVFDAGGYAIEFSYEPMGYVDDEDAGSIDYDDLLREMQTDTRAANGMRRAQGYPAMELIGWAATPYYDAAEKKLHWAKEIHFEGQEENTLNYNIRVLGRRGVLVMNFISGMEMLSQIQQDIPTILPSVNFNGGHRYADFNPSVDEIAAVGIGGLIAGKVLAKTGFFALLAKFGKFIVFGLIGLFAMARRFVTGRQA